MRYLMLVLIMGLVVAEESKEPKLTEAEVQYNKDYQAAKDQFDKAVEAAKVKLVASLNVEMKKLMANGDLDGAVALRDKIKGLENITEKSEPSEMTSETKTTTKSEIKTTNISLEKMVNNVWLFSWVSPKGKSDVREMKFSPDGSINKGGNDLFENKWKFVSSTAIQIWGTKQTVRFELQSDGTLKGASNGYQMTLKIVGGL